MTAYLDYTAAIAALLLASPALAGGYVKPGELALLPAEQAQGIFINPGRSTGANQVLEGGVNRWQTSIVVSMAARAADGQTRLQAIDALLALVYARLAEAVAPFGALPWTFAPDIAFDFDEADQSLGGASLVLRIDHFTAAASLSAPT